MWTDHTSQKSVQITEGEEGRRFRGGVEEREGQTVWNVHVSLSALLARIANVLVTSYVSVNTWLTTGEDHHQKVCPGLKQARKGWRWGGWREGGKGWGLTEQASLTLSVCIQRTFSER